MKKASRTETPEIRPGRVYSGPVVDRALDIHPTTRWRLRKARKLVPITVGGKFNRYRGEDVLALMEGRT